MHVLQIQSHTVYTPCSYLVNGSRSTDDDDQLKRKTKVMYRTSDPVFDEVHIKLRKLREMTDCYSYVF